MRITTDFPGGNLRVLKREGDTIHVENDLRDTTTDWFYWAFAVEDAAGETLTFDFGPKKWIGPYGPAVSRDFTRWTWLCSGGPSRFSFTFPDNGRVYFAHDLLYQTDRFDRLAEELSLPVETLCVSERGRAVPIVHLGRGDREILLTARHHACEATGDYVMEGILRSFAERPVPGYAVTAVPFVDYDGVADGDQGKNRAPHDHNRDYLTHPVYASVRAIQAMLARRPIRYCFDLHSPWHVGGENDFSYIVRKGTPSLPLQRRFGELLESVRVPGSFPYETKHDLPPNTGWNQDKTMRASFSGYAGRQPGVRLSLSLETSYYGIPDAPATQDSLLRYGTRVAEAIRRLIAEDEA